MLGMQMLQQPNKVTILYPHDQDHRQIRLNQSHPAKVTPSIHGDSVGHYEGDTLVVDTIGLNDKTFVDNFRTPHSEKLHMVERLRLVEGGGFLEAEILMDDPAVFLKPLHVTKRSRRVEASLAEWRCAAGEMNNPFAHGAEPLPAAEKPDF